MKRKCVNYAKKHPSSKMFGASRKRFLNIDVRKCEGEVSF